MSSEDMNKGAVHGSLYHISLLSGSFVHIFRRGYSTIFFLIHFLSVQKISKTYVFFLKTWDEYITRYRQRCRFHSGSCSPSLLYKELNSKMECERGLRRKCLILNLLKFWKVSQVKTFWTCKFVWHLLFGFQKTIFECVTFF